MAPVKVVVTGSALLTAYGPGEAACWAGLLAGRDALAEVRRFDVAPFAARRAALVPGLDPAVPASLAMQMFDRVAGALPPTWNADAPLFLGTTVGEIDLLERHVLRGEPAAAASRLESFAETAARRLGLRAPARIVSAACASSAAAVAAAASAIRRGETDCALAAGCDAVSEFVFSGFSALMALDPEAARPFDADRRGLTVGEGAALAVLESEARARRAGRPAQGEVAGWGLACDARHMTAPSRDGDGLVRAIGQALALAGAAASDVAAVCAHGTGTVYNDAMEMSAFRRVWPDPRPVFSIKGGAGHTMGAAGLVEMLVGLRALREGIVPPTVGLRRAAEEDAAWVSPAARPPAAGGVLLSTNSGFGGVNSALALRAPRGEGAS